MAAYIMSALDQHFLLLKKLRDAVSSRSAYELRSSIDSWDGHWKVGLAYIWLRFRALQLSPVDERCSGWLRRQRLWVRRPVSDAALHVNALCRHYVHFISWVLLATS